MIHVDHYYYSTKGEIPEIADDELADRVARIRQVKTDKVWKSRNALMIHLSQFCRQYNGIKNPYIGDDFIIEEEIFEKKSSLIASLDAEIRRLESLRNKKKGE